MDVERASETSRRCEHDAPGDLSVTELIQDFIGLVQRTSGNVAPQFSLAGHGQHVAKVLAGADRTGPYANFAGGHQDWREADIFRR
jgi:hypothetical protein